MGDQGQENLTNSGCCSSNNEGYSGSHGDTSTKNMNKIGQQLKMTSNKKYDSTKTLKCEKK